MVATKEEAHDSPTDKNFSRILAGSNNGEHTPWSPPGSRSNDTRGMFGGSNTHHNDQSGEAKWTQVALARHRLLACLQLCPLTLFLEPMCMAWRRRSLPTTE